MARDRGALQVIGSVIVAVVIVIATVVAVTAKLGPDGYELLEDREERREEDENSGRGSLMEELDRLWHAVGER